MVNFWNILIESYFNLNEKVNEKHYNLNWVHNTYEVFPWCWTCWGLEKSCKSREIVLNSLFVIGLKFPAEYKLIISLLCSEWKLVGQMFLRTPGQIIKDIAVRNFSQWFFWEQSVFDLVRSISWWKRIP